VSLAVDVTTLVALMAGVGAVNIQRQHYINIDINITGWQREREAAECCMYCICYI
jgi:hypothetical protein